MIHKPSAEDASELEWFKSSYSDSSSGNDCVEAAAAPGAVHVRDSKHVPGPHLGFTLTTWAAFLTYASGS
ncbi:DUF397 domain-containing protein [Streptomyces sp. NBC_00873]|uniref:DUF397 domain-containing protein n=1 Tax=unclassified Streptomyces TaxID=2593676 RepID=UPI0038707FB5|nr:DUF397 domain-containing protein [Streptomyces sp. NBC_00873]WTA44214.1 DUF397 domain-containing protein [Streptomyces sp. NBC_00842]